MFRAIPLEGNIGSLFERWGHYYKKKKKFSLDGKKDLRFDVEVIESNQVYRDSFEQITYLQLKVDIRRVSKQLWIYQRVQEHVFIYMIIISKKNEMSILFLWKEKSPTEKRKFAFSPFSENNPTAKKKRSKRKQAKFIY